VTVRNRIRFRVSSSLQLAGYRLWARSDFRHKRSVVIELFTKPRRHVVGIRDVNEDGAKSKN